MRDEKVLRLKYEQGTAARREMRCDMCSDRIVLAQNYFFTEEKAGPLCFSCLLEHEERVERYRADMDAWYELELAGNRDPEVAMPRMPEPTLPF